MGGPESVPLGLDALMEVMVNASKDRTAVSSSRVPSVAQSTDRETTLPTGFCWCGPPSTTLSTASKHWFRAKHKADHVHLVFTHRLGRINIKHLRRDYTCGTFPHRLPAPTHRRDFELPRPKTQRARSCFPDTTCRLKRVRPRQVLSDLRHPNKFKIHLPTEVP